MKKGFTTPFSSFFPGLFFYFFAFFDSLTPCAPLGAQGVCFFAF